MSVGRQEEHRACEKNRWWGAGVVICLEQGANDLHMIQLMLLPSHNPRLFDLSGANLSRLSWKRGR